MKADNLHNLSAAIHNRYNHPPKTQVLLTGPECGGEAQIALFSRMPKCRETKYCCVDIAIIHELSVRAIIEIENSGNIGPFKIGGKLIPVALSKHLIHPWVGTIGLEASSVTFIQIANTNSLAEATKKLKQYRNLESDIEKLLPIGSIATYHLIPGTASEFHKGANVANELWRVIDACLT